MEWNALVKQMKAMYISLFYSRHFHQTSYKSRSSTNPLQTTMTDIPTLKYQKVNETEI